MLLFILAVLYSFSGIFFGLDFTDSFYHLNQALRPANGTYLSPFFLSSLIIRGIIEVIGTDVFYIRILNWFLLFISLLLPFFIFRVPFKKYIVLSVIILFLYAPFNANILGYDTLSIFINSLLFTLTALYLKKRFFYLIYLIAFIGAISTMIRFPNILAIPVIFIFILISERIYGKNVPLLYMRPGLFLGLSLLLIAAGFFIYYENWEQLNSASSIVETSFLLIFSNYFRDGVKITGFIIMILLALFIYNKFQNRSTTYILQVFLLFYFVLIFYFFVGFSKYVVNYSLFVVAITISIILVPIFTRSGTNSTYDHLLLYLFFIFLFINPFGSNTGLLKAYSLVLLLPFILSINQIKFREFWIILLVVLIPFSILTKFLGIYEDKNLFSLNEKIESGELSNIYTSKDRKNFLLETDRIVEHLNERGVEVFFYGNKSHIFSYLYPNTSLNSSSFLQPEEELFQNLEVLRTIKGEAGVAIIIINNYPEMVQLSKNPIKGGINNYGFKEVINGNLKYYLKCK